MAGTRILLGALLLLSAAGLWSLVEGNSTGVPAQADALAGQQEQQPSEPELSPTRPRLRRAVSSEGASAGQRQPDESPDPVARPDDQPPEEIIEIEEEELSAVEWFREYGMPADTPIGPNLERFGPPDPLDLGHASLKVRLFDKHSGQPIAGTVLLWQLNAPANELWQAGDQDVALSHVPRKGHTFERLAGGKYRPLVLSERRGAPEAAALDVGGHTSLELFIEPPRPIPVRLKLPGEERPVSTVELFSLPAQSTKRLWGAVPAWVRRRIVQPHVEVPDFFSFNDSTPSFISHENWATLPWLEELGGCYDAGFLPEDQKGFDATRTLRLRVDGQSWPGTNLRHAGRSVGQPLIHVMRAPDR